VKQEAQMQIATQGAPGQLNDRVKNLKDDFEKDQHLAKRLEEETNNRRDLESVLGYIVSGSGKASDGQKVDGFIWHPEDKHFLHNRAVQG